MTDLDGDFLALGMREFDRLGKGCDLGILPKTEVLRGDSAFWDDGSGFDD